MTIDISEPLLQRAQRYAADQGKELADVVNDALVEKLGQDDGRSADASIAAQPYRATPFVGEPVPGIDFNSNTSIQEALDEEFRDPVTGLYDLNKTR